MESFTAKMVDAHTRQHGEPDEMQVEYLHALAADLVEQLQVTTFYASASRYGHPSGFTPHRPTTQLTGCVTSMWTSPGPERR